MKLTDLPNPILDVMNSPIPNGLGGDLTYREALVDAIMYEDVNPSTGQRARVLESTEVVRRFTLAQTVMDEDVPDIKMKDFVFIQEQVPKRWPVLIAARALQYLTQIESASEQPQS